MKLNFLLSILIRHYYILLITTKVSLTIVVEISTVIAVAIIHRSREVNLPIENKVLFKYIPTIQQKPIG